MHPVAREDPTWSKAVQRRVFWRDSGSHLSFQRVCWVQSSSLSDRDSADALQVALGLLLGLRQLQNQHMSRRMLG